MALVKCENCGAPVSNLGTKCPKCGTPIRKGDDGSVNEVTPAKLKRRHGGMVGWVVAVIVVAVGAAAFLLLGGKGGEQRTVDVSDSVRTYDRCGSCAGEPQAVDVSDSDNYQEEYSDDAEDYLDPFADWNNNYQEEYGDDTEDHPANADAADGSLSALGDIASTRKLVYGDISSLNKADLRLLRNTIYARHGYIFKSDDLKIYFSQYPWYSPRYTDVSGMLSGIEKYNVSFIQKHE